MHLEAFSQEFSEFIPVLKELKLCGNACFARVQRRLGVNYLAEPQEKTEKIPMTDKECLPRPYPL
jgi:hypothetical protein